VQDVLGHAGGLLSLRQGILDANASNGANTINLPAGTYMLSLPGANEVQGLTGDLNITGTLNIVGAGSDSTGINAAQLDRVFQVIGAKVSIFGVTITGGLASEGGGLLNGAGNVTLSQCAFVNNQAASGYGLGGAIANVGGALSMDHCTVSGNVATGTGN